MGVQAGGKEKHGVKKKTFSNSIPNPRTRLAKLGCSAHSSHCCRPPPRPLSRVQCPTQCARLTPARLAPARSAPAAARIASARLIKHASHTMRHQHASHQQVLPPPHQHASGLTPARLAVARQSHQHALHLQYASHQNDLHQNAPHQHARLAPACLAPARLTAHQHTRPTSTPHTSTPRVPARLATLVYVGADAP